MLANIREWQSGRGTWDFVRDVLIFICAVAGSALFTYLMGRG